MRKSVRDGRYGFTLIELLVVIAIIAILAAILFPVFTSARESGRRTKCLSQSRQIGSAIQLYADSNGGWIVWTVDASSGSDTSRYIYWPDLLKPYISSKDSFYQCPSRKRVVGKAVWPTGGVGLNHPDLSGIKYPGTAVGTRVSEVKAPGRTVVAGDAARISNPRTGARQTHPDSWQEGVPTWVFRTPDSSEPYWSDYAGGWAERMVPRHNGRANAVFLDGHVKCMKLSDLGFQYPSGNAKALWDIY